MARAPLSIFSGFLMGLLAGLATVTSSSEVRAQSPETARASHGLTAEEFSAQSRRIIRRAARRVPIYRGSSYPGPNSVRICNAHYEQEYRPSGTVIVPRMRCYWSG